MKKITTTPNVEFTIMLTKEDIVDIFIHWYENQIIGKMKYPGGSGENQVKWLTDEFIKTAKIVVSTREEWENENSY